MPSNFTGFDLLFDNGDGNFVAMPGPVAVKVRDVTDANPLTGAGSVALADVASDASGHVAGGVLAAAAGRRVRFFWVRDADGRCGSAVQVTS